MGAETTMIALGILLVVAVVIAIRYLNRHNDRAAIEWMLIGLVVFALFIWAQHRAERAHELKHAAEHRAVQEQVKDVRHF